MRRILNRLLTGLYLLLGYAPLSMLAGAYLTRDFDTPLIALGAVFLVVFPASFLPTRVGARAASAAEPVPARGSGDPDPDRNLRPENLPEEKRAGIPVRGPVCAAIFGIACGLYMALPVRALDRLDLFTRLLLGASVALFALLAPPILRKERACTPQTVLLGVFVYALAALAAAFSLKIDAFSNLLYWMSVSFLVVTGVLLNEKSLLSGLTDAPAAPPPPGVRRRNRVLLAIFAVIVVLVTKFQLVNRLVSFVAHVCGWVIGWLRGLYSGDPVSETPLEPGNIALVTGEVAPDRSGLTVEFAMIDYIAIGLFAVLFVVSMVILTRAAIRLIRKLIRKWKTRRRPNEVPEEAYNDERESVFSWDEFAQKFDLSRFRRRFARDPAWDSLTPRERVRQVVQKLIRKNAATIPNLPTLTVQESLPQTKARAPRQLAALYDRARYSQHEITPAEAEEARRGG